MENKANLNHVLATVGNGALLIWWGVAILIDPITIGITAIGTGLICLAVNAVRMLVGIPPKRSTTVFGLIALVWGTLDQAFMLSFGLSFAVLMIVIGCVVALSPLLSRASPATSA